ncbi:molybdate ABC transporter substrate-binding protein [Portibacter lacus]|uniref:ABC transporter substrate-binding protein n=1 Tax=Portibacter lacus TaxID=1099794 RepID=A0AA37SPI9_9BACT|nr:molybdate ABC transporter substrate-binding protein [Portibacter lacus]GLR16398.1 ABC transporter substrate-binding protein [Portibacter lacus]
MFVNVSKEIYVLFLLFLLMWSCDSNSASDSLLMYCAAGMKPVIQEVNNNFYKETGIKIDVQYAGSGTLLSNVRISKQGDIYLSADDSYIKEAEQYDLIKEKKAIAHIKPVIVVQAGNPKSINSLEDLLREDVTFVLANPDAASIGRQTEIILNEYRDFRSFEQKAIAFMPTVNEVLNTVKLGTSDAGIVWDANAVQYDEVEMIRDPFLDQYEHTITIGVLKISSHSEDAMKFINYLSSEKQGGKVMSKVGYEIVQ